jgi:hypothetical protein
MDDGSYRIIDQEGTDTYVTKGTSKVTDFQLSGTTMLNNDDYKQKQLESVVAYVFRNAWISSLEESSGITYASNEVIIADSDIGIDVSSYKDGRFTYYYANVTLYNRTDNKQIEITLDNLGCELTEDEGYITGEFNQNDMTTNPKGNPNTCSDLVNALLLHATFSATVFGMEVDMTSTVKNEAINALKNDSVFTAGGFSSRVYSKSYTSMGPQVYSNHFMVKTAELLSGAEVSSIYLYKKGTKKYSEYLKIK